MANLFETTKFTNFQINVKIALLLILKNSIWPIIC